MTIELLTPNEYDTLLSIQKDNPKLTFQNIGFQYINRNTFTKEEKEADKQVAEILKKHITGFVRFDNFLYNKKKELRVRFQYHYDSSFTGVGYITLRELLNGFDN